MCHKFVLETTSRWMLTNIYGPKGLKTCKESNWDGISLDVYFHHSPLIPCCGFLPSLPFFIGGENCHRDDSSVYVCAAAYPSISVPVWTPAHLRAVCRGTYADWVKQSECVFWEPADSVPVSRCTTCCDSSQSVCSAVPQMWSKPRRWRDGGAGEKLESRSLEAGGKVVVHCECVCTVFINQTEEHEK